MTLCTSEEVFPKQRGHRNRNSYQAMCILLLLFSSFSLRLNFTWRKVGEVKLGKKHQPGQCFINNIAVNQIRQTRNKSSVESVYLRWSSLVFLYLTIHCFTVETRNRIKTFPHIERLSLDVLLLPKLEWISKFSAAWYVSGTDLMQP